MTMLQKVLTFWQNQFGYPTQLFWKIFRSIFQQNHIMSCFFPILFSISFISHVIIFFSSRWML